MISKSRMPFRRFPLAGLLALFLSFPAVAAFDSAEAAKEKELTIQRITPMGEDVPASGDAARQIVIQFNRPVVPVGQMARAASELPITISPQVNCEWRWLNTSALACELGEQDALAAATAYEVKVNPGITAEDGETIAAPVAHRFITERPDISYVYQHTWKTPTRPVLRVTLNQHVTKSSLEAHLFFSKPALPQAVRVAIEARPDPGIRPEEPFFVAVGKQLLGLFQPVQPDSNDDVRMVNGEEARRSWMIEPVQELDADSSYQLHLEAGLLSAFGPERSVASRDVRQVDTFPAFRFLGVQCRDNAEQTLRFAPGQPIPNGRCDPLGSKQLLFSAPVTDTEVGRFFRFSPSLTANPQENPWGEEASSSPSLEIAYERGREFSVWLPAYFKAAHTYKISYEHPGFFSRLWNSMVGWFGNDSPSELTDAFGRPLEMEFDLAFATDHRRPNYEMPYSTVVLEEQVDSDMPLWVNNLERYSFLYTALDVEGSHPGQNFMRDVPKVQDVQFAVPFGVRDMLQGHSGALYGIFGTTPGVASSWNPQELRSETLFAQVTPYAMHVKLGHFQSLAWITDFATGQPVEGVKVTAYEDTLASLAGPVKPLAEAVTDAQGLAFLPGTEALDPDIAISRGWSGDTDPRLFFIARKEGKQALLPILYAFEASTYKAAGMEGFYTSSLEKYGHMRSWGTTAQGIYRAGDTIDYKIYVRQDDGKRLIAPPGKDYRLEIIDPTGKTVKKIKHITLNEFGAFHGQYAIPKQGAVGWYQFQLTGTFEKNRDEKHRRFTATPLQVLVADFTPAPFRVTTGLNGDRFAPGQTVDVDTQASLHAGGPYTEAALRVTAILDATDFHPKAESLKEFSFDTGNSEYTRTTQLFQTEASVNDKGEHALQIPLTPQSIVFGKLTVESAVQDDRGKYVTARAQADYAGVNRLAGLRNREWVLPAGKEAVIDVVVATDAGQPASDTPADVTIEKLERKGARVKGAGNAYLARFETEWVKVADCAIAASVDAQPCRFTPDSAGSYRAIARLTDTEGRSQQTELRLWASGGDYVLWDDDNTNALELIPQASEDVKVGDTVRYLVKNPFPGAQALITVERYGVIDHFTQALEGSTPIIEIPVKPDYVPGFYVSVTVMAPRVEGHPVPKPGEVDLGKPAFRMGYAGVIVKDPYKEMQVTATTDKETYRPRDKVTLTLHAEPKKPGAKEPIELAVAVLDESVFDLVAGGRAHFDPYAGFYSLEALDLRNYNLIKQLIGRQKFEKKGANPGGDGGADLAMRSLFKFVSYWNPSLPVDAKGNATVSFEVPDNLTGWRVLALAVTPTDRMGLGEGTFKVNRPTEIRPVMPNQVMEGDTFKAGFSVMNRTDQPRTLTVRMQAEGTLGKAETTSTTVEVKPFKRETVWLPLTAGKVPQERDVREGMIDFTVEAGDATDRDALTHHLPVKKWRALETAATYGTTTQERVSDSIAFPKEIKPDVGEVSVVLTPSVIGNIAGAFEYLRDYPYLCWEQQLTKALGAAHFTALKSYLPEKATWKGSESLPTETLGNASSFQAPGGGMAYFRAEDAYADPYLSAYTALGFNWLRAMDQTIPETVEQNLQAYLQRFLKQDVAPNHYNAGMAGTVRAVALAALADQGKVTLDDLDRYRPHVPQMSLFGKTHYLLAALKLKAPKETVKPVLDDILAHSNQSSGKVTFNETLDDSYTRLLASPMRENCAILEALTLYGEMPEGAAEVGDLPYRLVRTITQTRGTRDHWENTQENLFCMNALLAYSKVYEAETPAMQVKAALDTEPMGSARFTDLRDKPVTLQRPLTAADPGRKASVTLTREGMGRLYYSTRLSYAPTGEANQPVNAGIELRREYSVERDGKWVKLDSPFTIRRGELVLVDLYLSLPTARTYVVVDDPVPGGLEPVNRDLATSSVVDAEKGEYERSGNSWFFKFNDWVGYEATRWSFYHQELRHDSVRFYADYLSPGNYHLSYTAQAVAEGEFNLLPAKAEEMYDPDIFGKTASEMLKVGGAK